MADCASCKRIVTSAANAMDRRTRATRAFDQRSKPRSAPILPLDWRTVSRLKSIAVVCYVVISLLCTCGRSCTWYPIVAQSVSRQCDGVSSHLGSKPDCAAPPAAAVAAAPDLVVGLPSASTRPTTYDRPGSVICGNDLCVSTMRCLSSRHSTCLPCIMCRLWWFPLQASETATNGIKVATTREYEFMWY
eukprot:COSAG02_NODE_6400_length_3599_cov_1.894571_4_plen_190_part_00